MGRDSKWYASVDFKKEKVALFLFCISPVRKLMSSVVATVLVNMEVWKARRLLSRNISSWQSSVTTLNVLERAGLCHFLGDQSCKCVF